MTSPLLVDDALRLLESTTTAQPLTSFNGSNLETHASFAFPAQWDEGKHLAVCSVISDAAKALAMQDRFYNKDLGAAHLRADYVHDGQQNICHYVSAPGAVVPALDEIKKFIDTEMRRELANPEHWVRKTRNGTRYFVVDDPSKPLDYGALVKVATLYLGREGPQSALDLVPMIVQPNGTFTRMTIANAPHVEISLQNRPHEYVPPAPSPRQGIEISEAMAQYIMPMLGVDRHRIKDAPRELH